MLQLVCFYLVFRNNAHLEAKSYPENMSGTTTADVKSFLGFLNWLALSLFASYSIELRGVCPFHQHLVPSGLSPELFPLERKYVWQQAANVTVVFLGEGVNGLVDLHDQIFPHRIVLRNPSLTRFFAQTYVREYSDTRNVLPWVRLSLPRNEM